MLLVIDDIFSDAEAAQLRHRLYHDATWVDGNETSGAQAASAKKNRQITKNDPVAAEIDQSILNRLFSHPVFLSAALPHHIHPPLFNLYGEGEGFGIHVDNAIRSSPNRATPFRTDLSMTLFLTPPHNYEGGELLIETGYGAQAVKGEAGSLVLYPSTSLHKVNPVTKGERLSAFTWMQSMIRDNETRESLYHLDQSIQSLTQIHGHLHADVVRLTHLYHNLIRKWAEV